MDDLRRPFSASLALLTALAFALMGCGASDYCGAPGVAEFCTCGDGTQGAQVCQADNTLAACDCSGAIALANPDPIAPGTMTGGSSSGGGTVSSGGGTVSSGGGSVSSGGGTVSSGGMSTGGSATGGMETGGTATGGATTGGMETGGMTTGGTGGDVDPAIAYQGCPNGDECGDASTCRVTPLFQGEATVCQPECVDVGDCPVPDGTYEAELKCVSGECRFDCTPVLFQPLLSCPTGMECIAPLGGPTMCHDDGV